MSIAKYHVHERGVKKPVEVLEGTQPRRLLNKYRAKGFIVKKVFHAKI